MLRFRTHHSGGEWAGLIIVLLALAAAMTVLRWREYTATGNEERAGLQNQARAVGDHLSMLLHAVDSALASVRTEDQTHVDSVDRASLVSHLATLNDAAAAIRSLQIVEADGTVRASSDSTLIGSALVDQPCFKRAQAQPDPAKLYACAPYQTRNGGWAFSVLRTRNDVAGGFSGVVAATLDTDYLSAMLPSVLYASDMRVLLIDGEGVVIVAVPAGVMATGIDLSKRPGSLFNRFRALGQADASIDGVWSGGPESRMVAYHSVAPAMLNLDRPLLITLSRGTQAVYRPWLLTTGLIAALWLLKAGASSAALYFVQRRRRVQADEASVLQRQRLQELERIELVVEGADLSLWVWHAAADRMEIDARWCAMLGCPADDLLGAAQTWRGRVHPDDVALTRAAMRRQLAGEPEVMQVEYRMRHDGGHWIWVSTRGKAVERAADNTPVRLAGTHQDITERRRAEQALRTSEAQLRLITDAMPGTVARYDLQRRFLYANLAHQRLTGFPPGDLIGRTLVEVFGAQTIAPVEAYIQRVEAGEQVTFEMTSAASQPGTLDLQVTLVPDFDASGVVCGHFSITTDITERRAAEAERRLMEDHLRESQKMDSIGTLAGGIAHDFNNVLGAIIGNAELAQQEVGEDHPVRVSLEQISRASQRARGLVQQILTFSRKQPEQLVNQALQPLLEETLALLRTTLPARVELITDIAEMPLYVNADATQIQQVLMNLGTNAWHALHGSTGSISVGLDCVTLAGDAPPPVGDLRLGQYAHLWVSDDGVGMDAATRQRIFEPFFTTKPVGQGTGLGLSVVHGIVRTHLGAITVDTAPGQGSTFHLYLPATQRSSQVGALDEAEVQVTRGRGQHVMYVDDDDVIVLMVERLLERAGYRVTACRNAKQALAIFIDRPRAFDVVVTDYNMPGFSGLELAAEIAHIRPELPLVMSSGYMSEELRASAQRIGIRYLMHKQNTYEELGALVHLALAEAEAVRESVY